MKTSELIERLKKSLKEDGDRKVILASDNEENDHSPIGDIWIGLYVEELGLKYRGDAYSEEDMEIEGIEKEDGITAIILVPMR
jgi:hypothetical protein